MQISKISVHKGMTINLGDFENQRFDVEVRADLDPNEDPQVAAQALGETAEQLLVSEMLPTLRQMTNFKAVQWLERMGLSSAEAVTLLTDGPPF